MPEMSGAHALLLLRVSTEKENPVSKTRESHEKGKCLSNIPLVIHMCSQGSLMQGS